MPDLPKLMGSFRKRFEDPVFFVFGATGCGKSATAVALAEALQDTSTGYKNVLVVNCDVQQFYVGLPIATNKMQTSEIGEIPHCFLSFLSVDGHVMYDPALPYTASREQNLLCASPCADQRPPYNIHDFTRDACRTIDAHFKENRGSAVIVCGGTAYYLQSLLLKNTLVASEVGEDTLCTSTGTSECLTESKTSVPPSADDAQEVWNRLNAIDPDAAARYHPNNTRRILRLLQVYDQTGLRPSLVQGQQDVPMLRYGAPRTFLVWVDLNFEILSHHLDARVDTMVQRGLLEEVQSFYSAVKHAAHPSGPRAGGAQAVSSSSPPSESECRTPSIIEAIGYKELVPCCHTSGDVLTVNSLGVPEALSTIKGNTRRYAKQQVRWIQNRFVRRFGSLLLPTSEGNSQNGYWTHFVKLDAAAMKSRAALSSVVKSLVDLWSSGDVQSTQVKAIVSSAVGFPLSSIAFPEECNESSTLDGAQHAPPVCAQMSDPDARYLYCDVCEMHVYADSSQGMDAHQKTKRHRGAVRHQALVEKQRLLGREIPPRKRTRQ